MEKHKTITFLDHCIHYRDEGREHSKTLVLLHGFLQSQDTWSPYILSYMRTMRVIAIDLPGHGYSDNFGDVNTMEMMADAVKAVLDELDIEQCVLVGHSLGGYVALAFADRYPYYLRGLCLLHSHALPDSDAMVQYRQQVCETVQTNRAGFILSFIPTLFAEENKAALEQDIKDLSDQCLETRTEGILATQRGMAVRPSRTDVLERIEVPVLFVYGKKDNRIPIEIGVSQALLPHYAEVMVLGNVGHMSFLEERDYVKLRLKNFVDTCFF